MIDCQSSTSVVSFMTTTLFPAANHRYPAKKTWLGLVHDIPPLIRKIHQSVCSVCSVADLREFCTNRRKLHFGRLSKCSQNLEASAIRHGKLSRTPSICHHFQLGKTSGKLCHGSGKYAIYLPKMIWTRASAGTQLQAISVNSPAMPRTTRRRIAHQPLVYIHPILKTLCVMCSFWETDGGES